MKRLLGVSVAMLLLAAGCAHDRRGDDPDGDSILSEHEGDADVDGDGLANHEDADSDGDGAPDEVEAGDDESATPPVDSDQDSAPDFLDTDSDGDGLLDAAEYLGPDGVPETGDETDLVSPDSDADGFGDAGEALAGSDPNDPVSVPTNLYVNLGAGESATFSLEFQTRIPAVDIVFLMDSTRSMDGEIAAVRDGYAMTAELIESLVPEPAFAVAEFRDYVGYSAAGSSPFRMRQQVTTDRADVQAALQTVEAATVSGDYPEATYEALYQLASGVGFDMDGNQRLDEGDVPPFQARDDDAFGGLVPGVGIESHVEPNLPGVGFRPDVFHVVIVTTDARPKDPEFDFVLGNAGTAPAGPTMAKAALRERGIRLIGIATGHGPKAYLEELAQFTGAIADLDGDGHVDEPLVYSVNSDGSGLDEAVTDGVFRILTESKLDIALDVVGDKWDFVEGVTPTGPSLVDPGQQAHFDVTLTNNVGEGEADRAYLIDLELRANDGTVLLDELPIVIFVPRR